MHFSNVKSDNLLLFKKNDPTKEIMNVGGGRISRIEWRR